MNFTTIFGILLGSALLIIAIFIGISGEEFMHIDKPWGIFVNVPGLFIVLGGTIAATFISFPSKQISRVFQSLSVVFTRENIQPKQYVSEITRLAALARGGTLILEKEVHNVKNPFLKDGIQMLADEFSPEESARLCNKESNFALEKRWTKQILLGQWQSFHPLLE